MANLELTGGQYAMLMLFGTATCTYGTLEAVRVRSMVKVGGARPKGRGQVMHVS